MTKAKWDEYGEDSRPSDVLDYPGANPSNGPATNRPIERIDWDKQDAAERARTTPEAYRDLLDREESEKAQRAAQATNAGWAEPRSRVVSEHLRRAAELVDSGKAGTSALDVSQRDALLASLRQVAGLADMMNQ